MKVNIVAINREIIKSTRREKKKNMKPDNKKQSRNVKKYHDDYTI